MSLPPGLQARDAPRAPLPSTPEGCEHAELSFPPCSGTGPVACSRAQPQGIRQPLSCPCLRITPRPPGTRAPACHPRGAGTTPRPGETHGAGSLRQPGDGLGMETQRSRPERLPWAGGQAQSVGGKAVGTTTPLPFFICLTLINISQLRKQIERLNDTHKVTVQETGRGTPGFRSG